MSHIDMLPNVGPASSDPERFASPDEMYGLTSVLDELHMAALTGQRLSRVNVGAVDSSTLELVHDGSQTSVRFTQDPAEGAWTMVHRVQRTEDARSVSFVTETSRQLVPGVGGFINRQQYMRAAAGYRLIETPGHGPDASMVGPFTSEQCSNMTEELRGLLPGERWGWLLRPARALARGLRR